MVRFSGSSGLCFSCGSVAWYPAGGSGLLVNMASGLDAEQRENKLCPSFTTRDSKKTLRK